MKKLSLIPVIALLLLAGINQASAQNKESKKQAALNELVNSRHYTFMAVNATPLGGSTKELTTLYTLQLKGDTLDSNLPYYGRAYVGSLTLEKSPLDFRTSDFGYQATKGKKGGWDIVITPKKGTDAREMRLSVSADGYATLEVLNNNRDPISFYGHMQ